MDNLDLDSIQSKIIELENRMKRIKLVSLITSISDITINLTDKMLYQDVSGFEKKPLKYDLPSLYWIFANLCFIIEKNCYFFLFDKNEPQFLIMYEHLYGNNVNKKKTYDISKFENINVLIIYYQDLIKKIKLKINKTENIAEKEIYLINNSMHYNSNANEKMIQIYKLLETDVSLLYTHKFFSSSIPIKKFEWITLLGGYFIQGSDSSNIYVPDNQKPPFKKFVKSFQITSEVVTVGQYMEFIENGGYFKEELWTKNGWEWKIDNDIICPLYWKKKGSIWFIQSFSKEKYLSINLNLPIENISWFEAMAFAKWADARLPFEIEWEFCATNRGKTEFPWGSDKPDINKNNIEFKYPGAIDIKTNNKGKNLYNIFNMIGNVWEWCLDSYLPYNNFSMDILNSCINYNNFSKKKYVLKGGSWISSRYFINPRYRMGLKPVNRTMSTGFRLVRNI
jgi:ergothioneine biosynthesis protein EgtB